jgi:hypothetical protein
MAANAISIAQMLIPGPVSRGPSVPWNVQTWPSWVHDQCASPAADVSGSLHQSPSQIWVTTNATANPTQTTTHSPNNTQ